MKNLIILLSSIMLVCLAGCEEDKEIKPINPLIENSAETCEILNANVDALHAIIEAMENNLPVTQNVASNRKNSITFSNNRLAHIYLDTSTNAIPFIYAKKENGVYYWCRNGVWLLDANQNRVEVLKNKLSFKIIDGYWFISFDNKKYENFGEVSGDECIRFFKSFNTETKAITFVLSNQHKYEYRWYDENDIRFEDPEVEKICIDNWDTNHDMALSYDEAAAVTDIGNVFNRKSIVSFDELQYFVGLQTIGYSAFLGCSSLTSINIPDSVTSIGDNAFYNCSSLTSITIPNSVTAIGNSAFYNCSSLTSINIPNSVTSIGSGAFYDCSKLREFKGKFASTDSRCLIVNNSLIAFAPAGLTEYTIPDSVTSIGSAAFYDCSKLTSITIPDSVTAIGNSAFYNCSSLTSINIPNSVTSIGSRAFSYCSSLKEFKGKFASTDSRCLIVNNSLIAFAPAGLTEYTIPDSVTSIGSGAFFDCSNLTSINIPNSVTSIGSGAFNYCSSLTSITIPNSVTAIGASAFMDCSSLTFIIIPNSVTSIGSGAFSYCSSLTSITIPNSVTSIEYATFSNCSKLTSIYCTSSTPPTGSSYMFDSNVTGRKIYVPKAAVDAYKTAAYWSSYANDIVGYDF